MTEKEPVDSLPKQPADEPASSKAGVEMSENAKNLDLIHKWYQSYYMWSITASHMALNGAYMLPNGHYHNTCFHGARLSPMLPNQHAVINHHSTAHAVPAHAPSRSGQAANGSLQNGYIVPSLLKRFFAEIFDCIYIQLFKIIVVVVLLNYTELINEDSLNVFDFIEDLLNEENMNNIRLPIELLLLEVVYVLISVFFEAYCLYKRGCTPGKYLFNLKVISCIYIVGHANRIQVIPGGRLSLKSIFMRTFLKNFSIVFLFPTIIFFILPAFGDYGQTSYDKASESIVVQTQ